jgi:cell division protein FtsB
MSLDDLEKNIEKNNHLPGLPSAATVEEQGFELADMQKRVLEKVEELTLYTIEQNKQIKALQQEMEILKKENKDLKKAVNRK